MTVETPRVRTDTASGMFDRDRIVKGLLKYSRTTAGLLMAVALVWAVFSVLTDGIFISDRNIVNLIRQTSVTAMVAMGMLVVIAQGEIDLSVGSFLGVCATVVALLEASSILPPFFSVLVALGLGIVFGLWNGLWVAKLGIPAFVATLGGMLAFRGLSLSLSGGRTISGIRDEIRFLGDGFITGWKLWLVLAIALLVALAPLRQAFDASQRATVLKSAGSSVLVVGLLGWVSLSYRGLPMPVALVIIVAVGLAWALNNTVWGRHSFAVGGNRAAARVAGIPIGRHLVLGYVLLGVLAGVAALLFIGRLGAAPPEAGYFLELNAISAVVIGGASLFGGSGTVLGVLLGAILMQSLSNGLSLMNVPTSYQNIATGLVLMLAIYLDTISKRDGKLFLRQ